MFIKSFEKTAALDFNKIKGAAMGAARSIKNKPGMAIGGAIGGAVTGAMSRDEFGNRQGLAGAAKGAAMGGAAGALGTLAQNKVKAMSRLGAKKAPTPAST